MSHFTDTPEKQAAREQFKQTAETNRAEVLNAKTPPRPEKPTPPEGENQPQ
jgi:hypothetical protein